MYVVYNNLPILGRSEDTLKTVYFQEPDFSRYFQFLSSHDLVAHCPPKGHTCPNFFSESMTTHRACSDSTETQTKKALILKDIPSPHSPHSLKCHAQYLAKFLPEFCLQEVKWTKTRCSISEVPNWTVWPYRSHRSSWDCGCLVRGPVRCIIPAEVSNHWAGATVQLCFLSFRERTPWACDSCVLSGFHPGGSIISWPQTEQTPEIVNFPKSVAGSVFNVFLSIQSKTQSLLGQKEVRGPVGEEGNAESGTFERI